MSYHLTACTHVLEPTSWIYRTCILNLILQPLVTPLKIERSGRLRLCNQWCASTEQLCMLLAIYIASLIPLKAFVWVPESIGY